MTGLWLLLDEHYPAWLAQQLLASGIDVVAGSSPQTNFSGADDVTVLRFAVSQSRVMVTEDNATFPIAALQVPDHVGIVYVHPGRYQRTRPGLNQLFGALTDLAMDPPIGLGKHPVIHWLRPADR